MDFNIIKFRRAADICTCVLLILFLLILPVFVLSTVKLHNAMIHQVNNINVRIESVKI